MMSQLSIFRARSILSALVVPKLIINLEQKSLRRKKIFSCGIFLVFCTDPPVVQHATHNGAPDVTTYSLETVLKYACYPGYLTVGFAHAKCFLYNDTAQWFGPDITCKGSVVFT